MNGAVEEVEAWWATSPLSGAIGILHLNGRVAPLLEDLVGRLPEVGGTMLVDIDGIDTGLLARPNENSALLMPHGGPQIRRRVTASLTARGASFSDGERVNPLERWPEASSLVEACMLDRLARTASPRAVGMLLRQPELHRSARQRGWRPGPEDQVRADALRPLLDPPMIALVGAPNVGKSSLLNRMAGRDVAITADLPGTTRDAVTARVEIDGMACLLLDMPGQRAGDDPVEQKAIALSKSLLLEASLVVGLVDRARPLPTGLGREPDLVVTNKCDDGPPEDGPGISARTGAGIESFGRLLRRSIVTDEAIDGNGRPWCFHPVLLDEPPDQSPTIE